IHRRVSHTDDQNFRTDAIDVAEVHGAEPLDTDVNFLSRTGVPASGDVQFFSFRRAASDEDRIVTFSEQRLHALDRRVVPHLRTHVDDALRLFIQHALGQSKSGDVVAHQSAGTRESFVTHYFVTHGQKI